MSETHKEAPRRKDFWDILSSLGGPLVALVLGTGAWSVNDTLKEREARVALMEIAVDVLKDQEQSDPALRSWAEVLLEQYSGFSLRTVTSDSAVVPLNRRATHHNLAGYAHVSITSEPEGALVWLIPNDYPEVRIPAPSTTPTEMNVLAGPYGVEFHLGDQTQLESRFIYYNLENSFSVTFE